MIGNLAPSIIRTVAGYLVAALLALPIAPALEAQLGIDSTQARTTLTAATVLLLGSAYYALARRLEQRWPALSMLLGSRAQPHYQKPPTTGEDAASIATKLGLELTPTGAPDGT